MTLRHKILHALGLNACRSYAEWVGDPGYRLRVGAVCLGCGERTPEYDAVYRDGLPAEPVRVPPGKGEKMDRIGRALARLRTTQRFPHAYDEDQP